MNYGRYDQSPNAAALNRVEAKKKEAAARFNIKDFVVVADSGLLNKTNVELLRQAGYKYILGARTHHCSAWRHQPKCG